MGGLLPGRRPAREPGVASPLLGSSTRTCISKQHAAASEFARIALRHCTVATISDPHEIANVLGIDGVRWMLDNAALVPFHFLFGAESRAGDGV